MAQALSKV